MKAFPRILALGLALAGASAGFAQPSPPPPPATAPQTLHVVISPPLGRSIGRAENLAEDVKAAFDYVFRHRNWPVRISVEEFADEKSQNRLELEVLVQPIRHFGPDELIYTAWTKLKVDQRKYDLGIVKYDYEQRLYEDSDLVLEDFLRGAARATADKIEPLLFPKGK